MGTYCIFGSCHFVFFQERLPRKISPPESGVEWRWRLTLLWEARRVWRSAGYVTALRVSLMDVTSYIRVVLLICIILFLELADSIRSSIIVFEQNSYARLGPVPLLEDGRPCLLGFEQRREVLCT